jgi:hypothetical protein
MVKMSSKTILEEAFDIVPVLGEGVAVAGRVMDEEIEIPVAFRVTLITFSAYAAGVLQGLPAQTRSQIVVHAFRVSTARMSDPSHIRFCQSLGFQPRVNLNPSF